MNAIVPFHGVNLATAGRPDIRAMIKHYTAPYRAAVPFQDLIETVKKNSTPEIRRCKNRRPGAALAIHRAVASRLDAVIDTRDRLSVIGMRPNEDDVRAVVGAMLMTFPEKPNETSSFFIDALVLELCEPDIGDWFSLPAITAAAREMWQTEPTPPAISTFLSAARKHQAGLDKVLRSLCDIIEAADWAEDQINGS